MLAKKSLGSYTLSKALILIVMTTISCRSEVSSETKEVELKELFAKKTIHALPLIAEDELNNQIPLGFCFYHTYKGKFLNLKKISPINPSPISYLHFHAAWMEMAKLDKQILTGHYTVWATIDTLFMWNMFRSALSPSSLGNFKAAFSEIRKIVIKDKTSTLKTLAQTKVAYTVLKNESKGLAQQLSSWPAVISGKLAWTYKPGAELMKTIKLGNSLANPFAGAYMSASKVLPGVNKAFLAWETWITSPNGDEADYDWKHLLDGSISVQVDTNKFKSLYRTIENAYSSQYGRESIMRQIPELKNACVAS